MTGFVLRLIACFTMLIDHIGLVFNEDLAMIHPLVPVVCRIIGRIAFPLFAFGIAEGATHTSSPGKYVLRMFIFALISQLPFMLMLGTHSADITINLFSHQIGLGRECSVMVTLLFGLIICTSIHEGRHFYAALALGAAYLVDKLIGMDYGILGVLFIAALYLSRQSKVGRSLVMVLFCVCFYFVDIYGLAKQIFGPGTPVITARIIRFFAMCVPAVLILFYNGKRGLKAKAFTYSFYPVHMLVLWVIWAAVNIF